MSTLRFAPAILVLALAIVPLSSATHGPAHGAVFPVDSNTLAVFEFEGDALDTSGNGRDLTAIATPSYVATPCGVAYDSPGATTQGFAWSTYASTLTHPFTIEMVLTPDITTGYRKLFSHSDTSDAGWYILVDAFNSYPSGSLGAGSFAVGQRTYLALVSNGPSSMDVYIDGVLVGSIAMQFTAPPGQAIFFRDDTATGRGEAFNGNVDAMRISSVSRTPSELAAVMSQLDASCPTPPVWTPELGALAFVAVGILGVVGAVTLRRRG